MRILVVGGLGYLGSVLTDVIYARKEHEVDIYDICLWDNESIAKEIRFNSFFKKIENINKTYDHCFYLAWPDIITIFNDKNFRFMIDKNISDLKTLSCFCKNIVVVGDWKDELYNEETKTHKIKESKKLPNLESLREISINIEEIKCPELYGPSPRMRWDTLVNSIIYNALISENIVFDDDYILKIPVQSIFSYAKTLVESVLENKYILSNFYESFYSLLEISFMVKSGLEKNDVLVSTAERNKNIDFIARKARYVKIKSNDCLEDACKNIKKQIEAGLAVDFSDMKYNNAEMINSISCGLRLMEQINAGFGRSL